MNGTMKVAASSTFWHNPSDATRGDWLSRISLMGFDGVTLFTDFWVWGDVVGDGQLLRAQLSEHQLQLASLVTSVHLDFDRYRRLAGILPGLRCQHLVLIGGSGRQVRDRQALARVLDRVGQIAAESGASASYHHHTGTSGESLAEVLELLAITDPSLVRLTFDSGHAALDFADVTGEDRCEFAFHQLSNRIGLVEFKDYSPATQLDTVLGDGIINFRALLAELDAHAYADWLILEQNPDLERSADERDECARRSLAYLKSLGQADDSRVSGAEP